MIKKELDIISAKQLLPNRPQDSNKGTFGKVLLICGSKNMIGCCALAVEGALRSGAGLVTVAFPDVLYQSLTARLTECIFLPLPSDNNGFISHSALQLVLDAAESSDVIVIGCGIGVGYAQSLITTTLLDMQSKPLVIDADSLNCISGTTSVLKEAKANILLTPHPGEMSRLTGLKVEEIQGNRIKVITDFCRTYNVNVLLKGHKTLICNSSGEEVYVNNTGNSSLAKGGSGDLLSGIIGGLTPALGGDIFKSAVLGAYVHGLSADIAASNDSEFSVLPSDCAAKLGKAYLKIEMSDKL